MGVRLAAKKQISIDKERQLLQALAEQLKLPLLQIARRAELAKLNGDFEQNLDVVELTADSALQLLDSYLLSIRLSRITRLEPVSVSAVLNRVAHNLQRVANQYQCELQLHLSGKYEPIMADSAGLEAALNSLGYVFIQAQAGQRSKNPPLVKLAAHRGKQGIVAGMFTETEGLGSEMFRRAHRLAGQSLQPLTDFTAESGAGVFIAESIFKSMSARLRVARHQKLTGLAATLTPSRQLALV